ncbi:MAG TPA: glycerophosphodiester phosphodiesterase family protein [Herpetosiphonaceae bacterium]
MTSTRLPASHVADLALARRHAPIVRFDAREPFLPSIVGYTVFHESAASPSFPRYVQVDAPGTVAIEYALWWDWDIQHLYELEHVWVFVDRDGAIVRVESSQHGATTGGTFVQEQGRPVLFAEPGKHAMTYDPEGFVERQAHTERSCGRRAGMGGVWVTPLFRGRIARTPDADQLVRTFLRRYAFVPAWVWTQQVDVAELPLVPWPSLDAAIPALVAQRVAGLDAEIPRSERHVLHVGHRGASAHAPENTLMAIRKAAELGAHMVELDVRMSADAVPVLCHDADVALAGCGNVPIGRLTAAELGRVGEDYERSVPTLADALDVCEAVGVAPYLEIKEGEAVLPTVGQLCARDLGRYSVIGSFQPAWVARATDRAPQIPTSILFGAFDADPIALARSCGATYVHPCWERHDAPHTLLTADWLARVRSAGLGIVCWHEERPDVLDALLKLGVSAICTDRLDLLRAVAARG